MPDIRPRVEPRGAPPHDDAPPATVDQPRTFAEPREAPAPRVKARAPGPQGLAAQIAFAAEPLPDPVDPAFGALFDRFGDARVVLLGAPTCGTAEFMRARAAITLWLVKTRGFDLVALEADGADVQALDAYVRGRHHRDGVPFADGPGWMWRNAEFDAFLRDLAAHNRGRPAGGQAGVFGLDVYPQQASRRAAAAHLDRIDPAAAALARGRFGGAEPWAEEPQALARSPAAGRYAGCEGAVVELLAEQVARDLRETAGRDDALLDGPRGARLAREAADYYRAMYYGGVEAWNRRSAHLFETLAAALEAPGAKAVVWAHSAHVGDARATQMGAVRGAVSLGQLAREALGDDARLIGFGTYGGTVAAAEAWDAPMEVCPLAPAPAGSHERESHDAGVPRFLLDLRPGVHSALRRSLADPRRERFVGACYRPDAERDTQYAEARLPEQYDAWVWFDESRAVTPLATGARGEETWPYA